MSKSLPQSQYDKDRPFLVVKTYRRPASHVRTESKGWAEKDANWSVFEDRSVVTHITRKNMREATVIIDVINRRCVKSRYGNDPDEVVGHYLHKFQQEVTEAMDLWVNREASKRAHAMANA